VAVVLFVEQAEQFAALIAHLSLDSRVVDLCDDVLLAKDNNHLEVPEYVQVSVEGQRLEHLEHILVLLVFVDVYITSVLLPTHLLYLRILD